MINTRETEVFAALRDALFAGTRLTRPQALREPTNKLARMLAGVGASLFETLSCRIGMPSGDLCSYCSREISGAQVTPKGDS